MDSFAWYTDILVSLWVWKKLCSAIASHNFFFKTHSSTNISVYYAQSIQFYIKLGTRVFFTRKSERFYAFRYKSTLSTALPSMLARTKIWKRTRSDYRLFLLWFCLCPSFFSSSFSHTQPNEALCSVFLAYLFLKFDHNNRENIVIKF